MASSAKPRTAKGGPRRLTLVENLDLRAAVPLVRELLSLKGRDLEVDASQVQRLGGQCLQVLLSAHATWEASGGSLRFVDPSPAFLKGLGLMGAAPLIDPAQAEASHAEAIQAEATQ
jgi:chemotaxis protein CheX